MRPGYCERCGVSTGERYRWARKGWRMWLLDALSTRGEWHWACTVHLPVEPRRQVTR